MGKMCIRFCDKHLICIISSFLQDSPKTGIFNSICKYCLLSVKQKLSFHTHKRPLFFFFFWFALLSVWTRTPGFRGSAACQVSQTDGVISPCGLRDLHSSRPGNPHPWAFSTEDSADGAGLGGASSETSRRAESPRRSLAGCWRRHVT